jgi:hypothetical protein
VLHPQEGPSVSGSTVPEVLAEVDAELWLLDKHEGDHSRAT